MQTSDVIIRASLPALLLALAACERGPSAEEVAARESSCRASVAAWEKKQGALGATYQARALIDGKTLRCLAYVEGGDAPGSRFESVIDVERDHVVAGCSDAREAMGDTPCQVAGQSASRAAGRKTIDRLLGR